MYWFLFANFIFLLKELFIQDKLLNVYTKELTSILSSIDPNKIPESYEDLVLANIKSNYQSNTKIKFDNDILHRSKVIKHFLVNNRKLSKTEKDFKIKY